MSTARIEKPDDIKCTLSFTMTLKDWRQIRKTLSTHSNYEELQIIREIDSLIMQLEKTYYPIADPI